MPKREYKRKAKSAKRKTMVRFYLFRFSLWAYNCIAMPTRKNTSKAKKAKTTKKEPLVSRHDLIADVVAMCPETAEVLMDFGVGCVGCHISEFETLEQGILGHGFSEEDLEQVLLDLNEVAGEAAKNEKV